MNLLRLMLGMGFGALSWVIASAIVSSLANITTLVSIIYAALAVAEHPNEWVRPGPAAAFVLSQVVYVFSEISMIARMAAGMEAAVDQLRTRMLRGLAALELPSFESLGQGALYDSITQGCQTISSSSHFLALTIRSALLALAILIYLAVISPTAFLLIGALLIGGGALYLLLGRSVTDAYAALSTEEARLLECVSDLLDGFKEQKLNSARGRALREAFQAASAELAVARLAAYSQAERQAIYGETTFNLMLGLVVFVVPRYTPLGNHEFVNVLSGVLFLSSPVLGLINGLMMVKAADAAAGRMQSLERRIAEAAPGPEATAGSTPLADFREIRLQRVEYAYPAAPGERPFVLGPIDLTIRRGEVLFIVGGNGAGKSTLLRLLLGLYPPRRGELLVDGREIGADGVSAYRELIAPVFSDFHLFEALYGIDIVEDREPAELLKWMEMDEATSIRGDRFERADLSTGQRKRLALIAALLEHRPILALDEWAADQDPGFRRKFYREIIPALKARGLTIVAITHDDRYFDVADRHLRLEEGMLGEPAPESAP